MGAAAVDLLVSLVTFSILLCQEYCCRWGSQAKSPKHGRSLVVEDEWRRRWRLRRVHVFARAPDRLRRLMRFADRGGAILDAVSLVVMTWLALTSLSSQRSRRRLPGPDATRRCGVRVFFFDISSYCSRALFDPPVRPSALQAPRSCVRGAAVVCACQP